MNVYLKAIEVVKQYSQAQRTPDEIRRTLKEIGILDEHNNVTPKYKDIIVKIDAAE